jgi:hypothetical protein
LKRHNRTKKLWIWVLIPLVIPFVLHSLISGKVTQ